MELVSRDAGQLGPKGDRGVEVEALVEVELDSEFGLVDLEEPTEPHDEDKNEPRITVGEAETTPRLAAFARVEGEPENEELTLGKPADSLKSLTPASLDLLELGDVHRVWRLRPVSTIARFRYEPDVSHPQGHARLGYAQLLGDVEKGPGLGAQFAGSPLLAELAAVPMRTS